MRVPGSCKFTRLVTELRPLRLEILLATAWRAGAATDARRVFLRVPRCFEKPVRARDFQRRNSLRCSGAWSYQRKPCGEFSEARTEDLPGERWSSSQNGIRAAPGSLITPMTARRAGISPTGVVRISPRDLGAKPAVKFFREVNREIFSESVTARPQW